MNTCPKSVTWTEDVPSTPSHVAVIVLVPEPIPVTRPDGLTVATLASSDPHAMVRPSSGFPPASFATAESCRVRPSARLPEPGDTSTVVTGRGVTVIVENPWMPSHVAVIVAVPGATAVTSPDPSTVATPAAPVDQVTTRPSSAPPAASLGVADSPSVCPSTTLAEAGVTSTEATGRAVTVSEEVPFTPSQVPVIVTAPALTLVTRPEASTVATRMSPLDHVTT